MLLSFKDNLKNLYDSSVNVIANDAYTASNGSAPILLEFSDGTKLRADYWRLIKDGRASISCFDHKQIYGLPAPIDAVGSLRKDLQGLSVSEANHDPETGDVILNFTSNVKLQILNFTHYEIWEITFPDGTGEYSNYAK